MKHIFAYIESVFLNSFSIQCSRKVAVPYFNSLLRHNFGVYGERDISVFLIILVRIKQPINIYIPIPSIEEISVTGFDKPSEISAHYFALFHTFRFLNVSQIVFHTANTKHLYFDVFMP